MGGVEAVVSLGFEGEIAILTIDSPPVNALSQAVRAGIVNGVREAVSNPAVKGIVLCCAGRTFIAGADIAEFGKPPREPSLPDVNAVVESSPKPVIAAIQGSALGGGLEVALSCHYRVASASAKLGFPEVTLGLLPGAGGTQRLPRLVPLELALEMVATGKVIDATAALTAGLIDEVLPENELLARAVEFARTVVARGLPLRKVRDLRDRLDAARGETEAFATFRKANAKRFRHLDAPEANIRMIEAALTLTFEEGIALERQTFQQLLDGPQSAAQRYAFFAERKAQKVSDISADTSTQTIKKVGVIGAGTMGGGIAMSFVNAGIAVTLVESNPEALERGLGVVRKNYEGSARRGRLSPAQVEQRMGLLTGTLDLAALADCDLIVEAIIEDMTAKQALFARLNGIAKSDAILATNTSYLDVNEIASVTDRPESVIGLHFFSPANVMRLLEIVRGAHTSTRVLATAMQLAKRIGKTAVVVGVCFGFVGNRMLAVRREQAYAMLMEGAMPWEIDKHLIEFGMPMGPFGIADLAGLDLGWNRQLSTGTTIREVLCEMDRRGQKTGAGFYDYDQARNATPSAVTEQVITEFVRRSGISPRPLSAEEILERLLYPMINEGARLLEEKIASRPSDIDVVWMNGYGWPVYRGGPMFYADTVGLGTVVRKLQEHVPRLGKDFRISSLLEQMAATGARFQDMN